MNGPTFDRVSRGLAAGASRRTVLRLLGGGVASGLLALARLDSAAAYGPGCRNFILSGGPDPTDDIIVDDDYRVLRNGVVIFKDADGGPTTLVPIAIKARVGDTLIIRAKDVQNDCYELSPLYLHCADGGSARRIHKGVPKKCPITAPSTFRNKRFTI